MFRTSFVKKSAYVPFLTTRIPEPTNIRNIPVVKAQRTAYENVRYLFPYSEANMFHANLAVTGDLSAVIEDSNSYIGDAYTRVNRDYEKRHTIYARLGKTYDELQKRPPDEVIDECVCSFMSTFDSVNFGHSLSIVIDFIHQYRASGLRVPIVLSSVSKQFPNILRILELWCDDIRFIDNNKIYLFTKIYFFTPVTYEIMRHETIVNEIIERSLERTTVSPKRNVFLVKLRNVQTNIVESTTAFQADALLTRLQSDPDWIVINPETMCIYDIVAYLRWAKCIVTSEGSISYGHAIFFDRSAAMYFLVKKPNADVYSYIDWGTQVVVHDNLDDDMNTICSLPTT